MKLLFWISALLIFYAYFFYPAWLYVRARLYTQPVCRKPIFPKISIVIAVRNEEKRLEQKLQDLQQLQYPSELLDIVVASDGSTDQTNETLKAFADPRLHSVILPFPCGKAEAINQAMKEVTGEIIVFMDARQQVAADSVATMVTNFADPAVGCVSGALMLGQAQDTSSRGMGSYWKIEKSIRHWESTTGSVAGATGALYAVRRDLIPHLPPDTVLDDVFIPMEVARRGARVVFESRAKAWDCLPPNPKQEFRRKVRTLYGNYQLLQIAPWLLTKANPIRFEFVSHKLCRLAVPFAFIGLIVSSAFLTGLLYRTPLAAAMIILILGTLAFLPLHPGIVSRMTNLAWAFVLLNTAAIVAFFYFAVGKKGIWPR